MKLYNVQTKKKYNGRETKEHDAVYSYSDIIAFIDDAMMDLELDDYIFKLENCIDNISSKEVHFKVGNYHDFQEINIILDNSREKEEITELLNNMIIDRLKDEILILSDGEIEL